MIYLSHLASAAFLAISDLLEFDSNMPLVVH